MKRISEFFKNLFAKSTEAAKESAHSAKLDYEQLPDEPLVVIYVTPYSQSLKFSTWTEQKAYDKARDILANKTGEFDNQYARLNPLTIGDNIKLSINDRAEFAVQQIRNGGTGLEIAHIKSIVHLAATNYTEILTNTIWHNLEKQTYYEGELI